jgi:hypothetical protein
MVNYDSKRADIFDAVFSRAMLNVVYVIVFIEINYFDMVFRMPYTEPILLLQQLQK